MKFRPHRGGLAESMAEVVELPDRAALIAHIREMFKDFGPSFKDSALHVENYGVFDERIGWQTYIVLIDGYGPVGFTDGPC